jgi:hypothetical protein
MFECVFDVLRNIRGEGGNRRHFENSSQSICNLFELFSLSFSLVCFIQNGIFSIFAHLSLFRFTYTTTRPRKQWPVRNRQLASRPVARHHANSWRPKPLVRVHRRPAASRNRIVTDRVQSRSEKSDATRRALNFSYASCRFNAWSEKLHRTLKPTWDSRVQPSGPSRYDDRSYLRSGQQRSTP